MPPKVSTERFVEVWQTSSTAGEAAKRLRMRLPAVYRRSIRLRAAGVRLKYFLPRVNVAALNAIVERT
jgi:hypothetical protein